MNAAYDEFASEHQQSSKVFAFNRTVRCHQAFVQDGLWTPREHDRFMQIVDQHPGEIQVSASWSFCQLTLGAA